MIGTEAQSLRVQSCRVDCLRAWATLSHGPEGRRRCGHGTRWLLRSLKCASLKVRRKEWVEALFDDIHALRVLSEESFHVSLRIRILLDLISVSKKKMVIIYLEDMDIQQNGGCCAEILANGVLRRSDAK
jgi:hypothetical protein